MSLSCGLSAGDGRQEGIHRHSGLSTGDSGGLLANDLAGEDEDHCDGDGAGGDGQGEMMMMMTITLNVPLKADGCQINLLHTTKN